jgi:hypothetical protein
LKDLLAHPRYYFEDMASTCPKFDLKTVEGINDRPVLNHFNDRIMISIVDKKVIKISCMKENFNNLEGRLMCTKGMCTVQALKLT